MNICGEGDMCLDENVLCEDDVVGVVMISMKTDHYTCMLYTSVSQDSSHIFL